MPKRSLIWGEYFNIAPPRQVFSGSTVMRGRLRSVIRINRNSERFITLRWADANPNRASRADVNLEKTMLHAPRRLQRPDVYVR